MNRDDFLNNSLIQDGVIRNLEIIGEAIKQQEFRFKYPQIEWKKIAGMRDKLIHDTLELTFGQFGVLLRRLFQILITNIKKEEGGHLTE